MNKLIALFLTVSIAASISSAAKVRRDAPPPNVLDDLQKHAATFQQTFSQQLQQLSSADSTQQLNKALKDGSDAVLSQLSAFSASLQAAMTDANGKAAEALKSARTGLQQAADELRKQHPDVEQHAAALRDRITSAVKQAAEHSQALAKDVAANVDQTNQKLAPQIKQAYDDFVKQAQKVQEQIHQAAVAKA